MKKSDYPTYSPLSLDSKLSVLSAYYQRLQDAIQGLNLDDVCKALNMVEEAYMHHHKMYVAGNGGSRATATHFGADMIKTIFGKDPLIGIQDHPFDVENLGDNIPTMTATGNDLSDGYDHVFSLPLQTKGRSGELLLVITGSGNSKNILKALEVAQDKGMKTLGFLGFDGGKAKTMLDHAVIISSDDYGVIEDMHSTLMHVITDYLKQTVASRYQ